MCTTWCENVCGRAGARGRSRSAYPPAEQDARVFLRALAGEDASLAPVSALECGFDHVVMNLPASAVQFLGAS